MGNVNYYKEGWSYKYTRPQGKYFNMTLTTQGGTVTFKQLRTNKSNQHKITQQTYHSMAAKGIFHILQKRQESGKTITAWDRDVQLYDDVEVNVVAEISCYNKHREMFCPDVY